MRKARGELYLSSIMIQQEEQLVSCGPISAELMLHYGEMDEEGLEEVVSKIYSVGQEREKMIGQGQEAKTLSYQEVAVSQCLPESLRGLVQKESGSRGSYEERVAQLRLSQLSRLEQVPSEVEEKLPEQVLFTQLVMEDKSILALSDSESYKQLVKREQKPKLGQVPSEDIRRASSEALGGFSLQPLQGEHEGHISSGLFSKMINTHLMVAASKGVIKEVELLLSLGADVNATGNARETPLHFAAQNGHQEMVEYLKEQGADINATVKDGRRPLHFAAQNGHQGIVVYLQEQGADINATVKDGRRPLHFAAQEGHQGIVVYLQEQGADIKTIDNTGMTPLHLAALNGHQAVVVCLLENGADINAKDEDSATPLHAVALFGYQSMVAYLLKNGADINAKTNAGITPLHTAAYGGHLEIVKHLVNGGANLNQTSYEGLTPLTLAKLRKHQAIITYLENNGGEYGGEVRPNFKLDMFFKFLKTRETPMNIATSLPPASEIAGASSQAGQPTDISECRYDPGSVSHSQQDGHEVDPGNDRAESAPTGYLGSISHSQQGKVKDQQGGHKIDPANDGAESAPTGYLGSISHSQQDDVKDQQDGHELDAANDGVEQELVSTLIQGDQALGAIERFIENKTLDINEFYEIKDKKLTPLQIAAAYEQPKTVKLLLKQPGILIDKATQNSNRTALHLAAERGWQETATILIEDKRTNPHKRTTDGKTALHFAAKKGCEPIIKALLTNNVTHDDASSDYSDYLEKKSEKHLDLADNDGNTPLHLAAQKGRTQVVTILLGKGANPERRNRSKKTAKDLAKGNATQEVIASYISEQQMDSTSHTLKLYLTEEYIGDEFECIKVYLEENKFRANSIINEQNHTFLYCVVKEGLEKTVRILVENEKEGKLMEAIHANNDYEHSPLYLAVQNGNFEIVRLLIYGRAIKDNGMKEEEEIEYEAVKAMIGTVRNLQDQYQRTLLHWAAMKDALEILQLLTEFVAIAAEKSELSKLKEGLLLYKDIMQEVDFVNKKDKDGHTALDLAVNDEVREYLKRIKKIDESEWDRKVSESSSQNCRLDEAKIKVISSYRSAWKHSLALQDEYSRSALMPE